MTFEELSELELACRAIRGVQEETDFPPLRHSPTASVVIVSYMRHQMLKCTVEQLFQQDFPELEIVVVDSSPNAGECLAKTNFPEKKQLTYIISRIQNLGVVRNIGLLASRGDVIIFIDDDVYVDTDFVSRHVRLHFSVIGKEAKFISGNCIARPNEPSQWVADQVYFRPRGRWAKRAYGVNFSVKRYAALACGGFNPYIRLASDEMEFFHRCVKKTNEALNGREVVLVHRAGRTGGTREYAGAVRQDIPRRMADRVIAKLSLSTIHYLPFIMGGVITRSFISKEILGCLSGKGLRCLMKEFLWYCLNNSIKLTQCSQFLSSSFQMAQPRVLRGRDVLLNPAKDSF